MSERLPVLKAKDLIRFLEREGFQRVHQNGSHATFKHPLSHRRVTVPIHSGTDLKRGLLRGILNDLNLTREEFLIKLKH